ncbi:hypothetical protein Lal_00041448 [Lupinus albus]|nr:hypothetical protein Lal_00041448 [Lupinus albus]
MDRDKSLLLAMTSSFITSSFPYPPPLFSFTHQMAVIMAFDSSIFRHNQPSYESDIDCSCKKKQLQTLVRVEFLELLEINH